MISLRGHMSEPAIASASELTVRYSHHTVLDGATLAIHAGERIGLVGRNGSGKSTFMKICARADDPDSGEYTTRNDLVIGYLPQNFELPEDATVLEATLSGAQYVQDLIAEYESCDPTTKRGADLMEKINHFDGWTIDSRATSLLSNLHAPDPERIISTLSGGEKRRVALARALLAQPDFLILDEPTNHLDTGSIEWLEIYLSRYTGTCLFVTHDRYFLDRIATKIVEIARGKCIAYDGNYTDYLVSRAERMAIEATNEHKRQRFLKKELEWVRRRPSARRTKSRDRLDKYFEIADQAPPEKEIDVDLIIPPALKLPNRVIEAEGLSKSIGDRVLFRNLDFKLEPGERIGIVGRNGMGKSTLIKTLLGFTEPDTGSVHIGVRTEINYVDQNRLLLDDQKSIFDEVGEGQEYVKLGDETLGLRAYLKRFLFSDERINTKIELLSGGERSRVLLAKILKKGGNVLVLDEPTNDLDLNTLRLLEEALAHFEGSVLVVSHDRYFLNRVCTGILAFEDNGSIHFSPGSYDYYLEKKAERDAQAAAYEKLTTSKEKAKPTKNKGDEPRKLKWKEERELETIEEDILAAEEEVAAQEAVINEPNFYAEHTHDYQDYETKLKEAQDKVSHLYSRWEELEAVRAAYENFKATN
ncbi:energy-dependent translational throttle protein EttA [Rubritalea halochordaticola]|uniref:Energy-dependent translational throttle protein EttA n=2 Tax=Rubritalea halochordaticola TaxID=714537 RepID=A0ABP9UU49_9BACT